MFNGQTVAVVVPAKDEETQIRGVLATMPPYVDKVYVIDDGSSDKTSEIADSFRATASLDIEVIRNSRSRGVGAAIAAGYLKARADRIEVTAVMAGDGQMDPDDLKLLIGPVVDGLSDYSKGNRFAYARGLEYIPRVRKIGNFFLSTATKIVSGYWHVSDTQCGYTAISLAALDQLVLENIYPSYGCPNDILVKLNMAEMRVAEVPVKPRYNVGEQSKMRVPLVVLPILALLLRRFLRRLVVRYLLLSGHPLLFAYVSAFTFAAGLVPLGIYIVIRTMNTGRVPPTALVLGGFMATVGTHLLLTAFWMDSDANRHLCVRLTPSEIRAYREDAVRRVEVDTANHRPVTAVMGSEL